MFNVLPDDPNMTRLDRLMRCLALFFVLTLIFAAAADIAKHWSPEPPMYCGMQRYGKYWWYEARFDGRGGIECFSADAPWWVRTF